MKYVVIEFQTWDTGAMATPSWAYDDRNAAEAKYHSVLAAAAVSALPLHACALMQADGRLIACASYEHVPEPEPVEMCDVTFDAAGGYGVMQPMACVVGTEAVVPPCGFTREGYLFAGWNTEYDGTGDAFAEGEPFTVTGPLALKAQWEQLVQDEQADGGSEAGDDGSAA